MEKQEFLKAVASVAEIVCGDEYLFGVIEIQGISSYISFTETDANFCTPCTGGHVALPLVEDAISSKDMAEKLLDKIDVTKVTKVYETC